MWRNITRYGGLITLGVTAYILTRRKVYSYPGYLLYMYNTKAADDYHRKRYPTFYNDHPVYGDKTRPTTPDDAKRGNILMLEHGRDLGVPEFTDKYGNPINNNEYNFLTIKREEPDRKNYNPHIHEQEYKSYSELLKPFPDKYFDFVLIIGTCYTLGSDRHFEDDRFVQELNRVTKDTGEIICHNENVDKLIKGRYLEFGDFKMVGTKSITLERQTESCVEYCYDCYLHGHVHPSCRRTMKKFKDWTKRTMPIVKYLKPGMIEYSHTYEVYENLNDRDKDIPVKSG
jgi:SAM-dependent methyltransferase